MGASPNDPRVASNLATGILEDFFFFCELVGVDDARFMAGDGYE